MDKFVTILDFFISRLKKNWLFSRGYFSSWGHALVAVAGCRELAVVEKFK